MVILAFLASPTYAQGAAEREIEAALINRVDDAQNTVGIIVGLIGPDGRRYLTRGVGDLQAKTEIGEESIFEIGSLTKVFTALLLADMAVDGEVDLNDPIDEYLPAAMTGPSFAGRRITLVDLATHTSGLPFQSELSLDSTSDMYDYVSTYELKVEPGTRYRYSNLGFGLLGELLSKHAEKSYEALLTERILEPLGMSSTTISLSDSQRRRMATGYNRLLEPVGLTNVGLHAGAGAVRSTASDMLTFAEAFLGLFDHPLESAMQTMLSITHPMPRPDREAHMGWIEIEDRTLFHIGTTRGFFSAFTIRPDSQQAAIVLSNSLQPVDTIALHAAMPERPIVFFEVTGDSAPD